MKRINIKEFRELGYLQEVNRRFLHPLGLALEVVQDEEGNETLGGVIDYREDPLGVYFDIKNSEPVRIQKFKENKDFVDKEYLKRESERIKKFKNKIEPI